MLIELSIEADPPSAHYVGSGQPSGCHRPSIGAPPLNAGYDRTSTLASTPTISPIDFSINKLDEPLVYLPGDRRALYPESRHYL